MHAEFPNYYRIIADNIKNIRKSNKLSQERFTEIAGCSREYISRLENYHEQISLQMLLNIAQKFELEPSSLLIKKL